MQNTDFATCNVYSAFLDQLYHNFNCAFDGLVCHSLKIEATPSTILFNVV